MAKATVSAPARSPAPKPGAAPKIAQKPDFGAELDAMIANTPEAMEFGDIPDGGYTIRIDDATFGNSKASGRKQLSWVLGIVEGDYKGRKVFKHDGMETPEQLQWIRGSLARLGYEWPSTFAELAEVVSGLKGSYATVTAKTKGGSDIQNVYFNEAVDAGAIGTDSLEAAPAEDAAEEPEVVAAAAPKVAPKVAPKAAPPKPQAPVAVAKPLVKAPVAPPVAVAPTFAVGVMVDCAFEDGVQTGTITKLSKKKMVIDLGEGGEFETDIGSDFVTIHDASGDEAAVEEASEDEVAEGVDTETQPGGVEFGFTKLNPLETKALNAIAKAQGFSPEDYDSPLSMLSDLCEFLEITGTFAKYSEVSAKFPK